MKIKRSKIKLHTWIALGLIVILLPIALFSLYKPQTGEAAWFDDAYGYRQRVSFTHNADLTDRRVEVSLDTATLIAAGKMQADCDDTRFTDINGKVLLYELTGTCDNAATTYDVIFPTIINGANVGYAYYGNPGAQTASQDVSTYTSLSPSGGAAALSSEEKGTGPAAYYNFDEGYGQTLNDGTSNNKNGTLGANASVASDDPTWRNDVCITQKCLSFDGTDDRVTLPKLLPVSGAFTVSIWVRHQSTGANSNYIFWQNETEIRINNSTTTLSARLWNDTTAYTSTSPTALVANRWYFVTFVYDGSSRIYLYIDGQLVDDDPASGNPSQGSGSFFGKDETTNSMLKGQLDEFRMYHYARSAAQIKSDFIARGGSEGASATLGGNNQKFLSDGLVGYWKMDDAGIDAEGETITDSSGNGNSGTLFGDNGVGDNGTGMDCTAGGKFGTGCSVDGTDDYITATDSDTLDIGTNGMTVSGWVNLSSSAADWTIIDKGNIFQDGRTGYTWLIDTTTSKQRLAVNDGTDGTNVSSSSPTAALSNTALSLSTWTFVTATWDPSAQTVKYYLNGASDGQYTTSNVGSLTNAATFYIAVKSDSRFFKGSLDGIRIYNRALSPAEVASLYNWAPGPVGYWKMDEDSGTSLSDISGNNLTGSFSATAPSWNRGKYGSALTFASNTYVKVPMGSNASLATNVSGRSFTYSLYFKPTNMSGTQVLLSYNDPCNNPGAFTIYLNDTGLRFQYYSTAGSTTITQSVTPSPALQNNQWYHLTWVKTFGQTGVKAYINGVAQTVTGDSDNTGYAALTNLLIGAYNGDATTCTAGVNADPPVSVRSFIGSIDDVKIYNYARNSGQIVEDMNGGHPAGGSPVGSQKLWWKFDDMQGTTAQDSGPNNYDGTLGGATLPAWKTDGKIGKALDFTAVSGATTGSRVTYSSPTNASLGTTTGDQLTLTLWLKPDSSQTNPSTAYFIRNGTGLDMNYGAFLSSVSGGYFLLSLQYHDGTNFRTLATTARHVQADAWNHVALVFTQGTDVKVYVNGTLRQTLAWTGSNSVASTTTFNIGGHPGANSQSIDGYIDEVKVYSGGLTDEQIKIDANAGGSINFGATANTEASLLSDGAGNPPVAYWPMDEKADNTCTSGVNDVCDKSGNGNDAANTGSPIWTRGKYGSALEYDGTNSKYSKITTPGSTLTLSTAGTLEAWVKSDIAGPGDGVTTKFRSIVSKTSGGGTGQQEYGLDWHGSSTSVGTLRGAVGTADGFPGLSYSYSFIPGTWTHLAFTWDTTGKKLFVNGKVVASDAVATTAQDIAAPFRIGAGFGDANTWDGGIDEVKIYDYARTPAQIAYDYNRGEPIAHWKFDECQGAVANDSSENGNNGTINPGDNTGDNDTVGTCASGDTTEMWGEGATGRFNSSLGFDGTNDSVTATLSQYTSISTPTIAAWIYIDSSTGTWQVPLALGTTNTLNIACENSDNQKCGCDLYNAVTNPVDIGYDTWTHIACTKDGTNMRQYINGKLTATEASTSAPTNQVSIGKGRAAEYYTRGKVDDVRVYNYALSADQVKKLMTEGGGARFGPATGSP